MEERQEKEWRQGRKKQTKPSAQKTKYSQMDCNLSDLSPGTQPLKTSGIPLDHQGTQAPPPLQGSNPWGDGEVRVSINALLWFLLYATQY